MLRALSFASSADPLDCFAVSSAHLVSTFREKIQKLPKIFIVVNAGDAGRLGERQVGEECRQFRRRTLPGRWHAHGGPFCQRRRRVPFLRRHGPPPQTVDGGTARRDALRTPAPVGFVLPPLRQFALVDFVRRVVRFDRLGNRLARPLDQIERVVGRRLQPLLAARRRALLLPVRVPRHRHRPSVQSAGRSLLAADQARTQSVRVVFADSGRVRPGVAADAVGNFQTPTAPAGAQRLRARSATGDGGRLRRHVAPLCPVLLFDRTARSAPVQTVPAQIDQIGHARPGLGQFSHCRHHRRSFPLDWPLSVGIGQFGLVAPSDPPHDRLRPPSRHEHHRSGTSVRPARRTVVEQVSVRRPSATLLAVGTVRHSAPPLVRRHASADGPLGRADRRLPVAAPSRHFSPTGTVFGYRHAPRCPTGFARPACRVRRPRDLFLFDVGHSNCHASSRRQPGRIVEKFPLLLFANKPTATFHYRHRRLDRLAPVQYRRVC
ncbi:hypothetical protein T08_9899 [Trichinella sp. T8]|nr:hypothetical protein T08_9899 [Trichinella sp. T8]